MTSTTSPALALARNNRAEAAIARVRAIHVEKHGETARYAPDDWSREGEPISWEPYVICAGDGTMWPCSTIRALGQTETSEPEGAADTATVIGEVLTELGELVDSLDEAGDVADVYQALTTLAVRIREGRTGADAGKTLLCGERWIAEDEPEDNNTEACTCKLGRGHTPPCICGDGCGSEYPTKRAD